MSCAQLAAKARRGEGYFQSHNREAAVTPFDKYAVTVAKRLLLPNFVNYAEVREATVMPRLRGVAASSTYLYLD